MVLVKIGMNNLKMQAFIGIIAIYVLLMMGCTMSLTPVAYVQYFEKNRQKFTCTVERNGMRMSVCHYPTRYYVARELQSLPDENIDKISKKYKESLFFVVTVADERRENGSTLLERNGLAGFGSNVIHNSFGRENDIFMVNSTDTVKAASCIYERNWGVGNEDVFTVTFARSAVQKKRNLKLRIREIAVELGTIEIPVNKLLRKGPKVQGLSL